MKLIPLIALVAATYLLLGSPELAILLVLACVSSLVKEVSDLTKQEITTYGRRR